MVRTAADTVMMRPRRAKALHSRRSGVVSLISGMAPVLRIGP
jgi:hypothetical protein